MEAAELQDRLGRFGFTLAAGRAGVTHPGERLRFLGDARALADGRQHVRRSWLERCSSRGGSGSTRAATT